MTKGRINFLLDYVALIAITISCAISIWTVFTNDYLFTARHYVGFVFLVLTWLLIIKHHKLGVLALGLTLFLGLFNLLTYSAAITTYVVGNSITETVKFQGIFLFWLLIYFAFSHRYFFGIATKKYWADL